MSDLAGRHMLRTAVVALVIGVVMRQLAALASTAWAFDSGMSGPLMNFVNIAALWLVPLAVVGAWSMSSPWLAGASGALGAWLAFSLYYGVPYPGILHELVWFGIGVPAVAAMAALIVAAGRLGALLVVAIPLLAEPLVLAAVHLARRSPGADDVILWAVEIACGFVLVAVWWRQRVARRELPRSATGSTPRHRTTTG